MTRLTYIVAENFQRDWFDVFAVADGQQAHKPISNHATREEAMAAVKRYAAADKRRREEKGI